MSSREIAGLTGKNHADVMRDIRNMLDQLKKANLLPWVKSTTYVGKDGRHYPQYELDKEATLTEQPASAKEPAAPDAQPHVAADKRAIQCGAQLGKVLRLLPLRPGHAGAHADLRLLRAAGLVPLSCLLLMPLQDARLKVAGKPMNPHIGAASMFAASTIEVLAAHNITSLGLEAPTRPTY